MSDKKPDRKDIAVLLKSRYELNDIQVTNVIEYAYSLSSRRSVANDIALAHHLNEMAIKIFSLLANNNIDVSTINRDYILLVDILKKIYVRNEELSSVSYVICWKDFDRLEGIDSNELWTYANYRDKDYGQAHNAEVNKLCIINGKEVADIPPDVQSILEDAMAHYTDLHNKLLDQEPRDWLIPRYWLTYNNGSIVINDTLTIKKTQAGMASDNLMVEAISREGQKFKPNLGKKYSRNITTTLSGMGFKKDGALQKLFFPTSTNAAIVFRSQVSREQADKEHIDTAELDAMLKESGADTERIVTLEDVPF